MTGRAGRWVSGGGSAGSCWLRRAAAGSGTRSCHTQAGAGSTRQAQAEAEGHGRAAWPKRVC